MMKKLEFTNYFELRNEIKNKLNSVESEIMDMFDGKMFDKSIYEDLCREDRNLYSGLIHMRDMLKGSMDTFLLLEGGSEEETSLFKLSRWVKRRM